jgi:hypothetical protein
MTEERYWTFGFIKSELYNVEDENNFYEPVVFNNLSVYLKHLQRPPKFLTTDATQENVFLS